MGIDRKTAKTLRAVYDACLGAASEYDVFDGFYDGGSDQLLADFGSALKALGIKTLAAGWSAKSGESRVWDAVNAAKAGLALGGLDVSDYGDEGYGRGKPKGFTVKMPSPEGEVLVECPLGFQDWSGRSGLGMIAKIRKPDLGLDAVTAAVDAISDTLKPYGFKAPRVTQDPGPGAGKSAWFVRFGLPD